MNRNDLQIDAHFPARDFTYVFSGLKCSLPHARGNGMSTHISVNSHEAQKMLNDCISFERSISGESIPAVSGSATLINGVYTFSK